MNLSFDYLIVGAGFSGCVIAERLASVRNKKVLIIDQRSHIGGNAYDSFDEFGILIHKYGPHIFHTNSDAVWKYLSAFTEWDSYYHKVLGEIDGKRVPIPFNLNSLYDLFPASSASKIEGKLLSRYGQGAKVPILELKQANDSDLKELSEYIYQNVFLNYTIKQWGFRPEELLPTVTARVPVFVSRDNRYFQDQYQGMPKYGYTRLFEKMVDHKNIKILLNIDYQESKKDLPDGKIIFTGPIDSFYNYQFGSLPYRSLSFDFDNIGKEYYQEAGTVNFPNQYDYTRITEFKYLTGQKAVTTTIAKEYPKLYEPGFNIPYYPIPKEGNVILYNKYAEEAEKAENVYFAGRLGTYSYLNMDSAVLKAMEAYQKH